MHEWVYGRNAVCELLRAKRRHAFRLLIAEGAQEKGRLVEILSLAKSSKVPLEHVPRARLDNLCDGHQGVILETEAYPYSDLGEILSMALGQEEPPFILILDALQDPQNLGTLLRTAEIVGVQGVLLPFKRTATVTPAVVNASSGASEHLLIAQANLAQSISTLKDAGVWVVGLQGEAARDVGDVRLDGPLALVVGNEGEGMRPLVARSCDALVRLPMRGRLASLNAATAGSIALYLAWQARGFPGAVNPLNSIDGKDKT